MRPNQLRNVRETSHILLALRKQMVRQQVSHVLQATHEHLNTHKQPMSQNTTNKRASNGTSLQCTRFQHLFLFQMGVNSNVHIPMEDLVIPMRYPQSTIFKRNSVSMQVPVGLQISSIPFLMPFWDLHWYASLLETFGYRMDIRRFPMGSKKCCELSLAMIRCIVTLASYSAEDR